jgi:hypothetical protein
MAGHTCFTFFTLGGTMMFARLTFVTIAIMAGPLTVAADEFGAMLRKVDGNKLTISRWFRGKEGQKGKFGPEETVRASAKIKVAFFRYDPEKGKYEEREPVKDGLKNDIFKTLPKIGRAAQVKMENNEVTRILVERATFGGGRGAQGKEIKPKARP